MVKHETFKDFQLDETYRYLRFFDDEEIPFDKLIEDSSDNNV